ncbi:MAG: ATP-binding cassette domain-containing protein [Deltaproteobacteria bacterium]|nr:ATP-binding cassette domain-containing protein [Deltaproteobacteria bacterium]
MSTGLIIENLSVLLGDLPVLENFSIAVEKGEILAILGPSGCGKTTLLNVVSGLQEPTHGHLDLGGNPIGSRLGQSAYMYQEDRLLPWRTVKENALLASEFEKNSRRRKSSALRSLRLLKELDLATFHHHYPKTISGGMSRRVALSRTLSVKRSVYLFDEPLSGLDYQLRLRVEEVIFRELSTQGATALIVTHDIETALALADRIILLAPRPTFIQRALDCGLARHSNSTVDARKRSGFSKLFLEILGHFDEMSDGSESNRPA